MKKIILFILFIQIFTFVNSQSIDPKMINSDCVISWAKRIWQGEKYEKSFKSNNTDRNGEVNMHFKLYNDDQFYYFNLYLDGNLTVGTAKNDGHLDQSFYGKWVCDGVSNYKLLYILSENEAMTYYSSTNTFIKKSVSKSKTKLEIWNDFISGNK